MISFGIPVPVSATASAITESSVSRVLTTIRPSAGMACMEFRSRLITTCFSSSVLTTEGGIYLPESAQEKPRRGTVLAVGEGKRLKSGALVAPDLAVGDRVLYAKYGGTEVKVDGEELLIMNTSQILAKYPEEGS